MLKRLLIASLAAVALALNAPVALADHVEWDCGFNTIAQEQVTGGQDTYTGVLYGYAVTSTPGEWVGIRCYVMVDGTAVTPIDGDDDPVPNVQFDTFTQQVTYTASDTQDVDVCARVLTGPSEGNLSNHVPETCFETTTTQIPPQEIIDALNSVFDLIADATAGLDPLICGLLQSAGVPGLVNVLAPTVGMDLHDCDLYLLGDRLIDFVPYDD